MRVRRAPVAASPTAASFLVDANRGAQFPRRAHRPGDDRVHRRGRWCSRSPRRSRSRGSVAGRAASIELGALSAARRAPGDLPRGLSAVRPPPGLARTGCSSSGVGVAIGLGAYARARPARRRAARALPRRDRRAARRRRRHRRAPAVQHRVRLLADRRAAASPGSATSRTRSSRPPRCCSRACSRTASAAAGGAIVAAALLGVAILVDGMPIWGSDIGGVLSMVPAYAIAVTGLLGLRGPAADGAHRRRRDRVRARRVHAASTSRGRRTTRRTSAGSSTSTRSGGWHSFSIVIERKLVGELRRAVLVAVDGDGADRARRRRATSSSGPRAGCARCTSAFRRCAGGCSSLAVLAVLGFSLNDSGISIPGVMLGVLTPVMIVILVPQPDRDGDASASDAVSGAGAGRARPCSSGFGGRAAAHARARPTCSRTPALARANYRGKPLPTAGGLLVVLAVLLVEGVAGRRSARIGVGNRPGSTAPGRSCCSPCLGFGLLGLLDDMLATGDDRGLRRPPARAQRRAASRPGW